MTNDLYREEILEHYHNPLHFGKLEKYTHHASMANPFCGDSLTLFSNIHDGFIKDISFTGEGCAISIAGASMLTEYVKGKKALTLTKFTESDMLSLLGIAVSESRKKCALLAYATLQDSLNNYAKIQSKS